MRAAVMHLHARGQIERATYYRQIDTEYNFFCSSSILHGLNKSTWEFVRFVPTDTGIYAGQSCNSPLKADRVTTTGSRVN